VGRYPPKSLGVYDLAGNVREWTHSPYQNYPHQADATLEDPCAPGSRLPRGGSGRDEAESLRAANRHAAIEAGSTLDNAGFRCARSGK
jgi:formylglycine-generating enzyme required for sulfatase activity